MREHTPTPWCVPDGEGNESLVCQDADGRAGIVLFDVKRENRPWKRPIEWDESAANAAFIVKAVNAYDALVKALEGLINAGNAAVGADPNDTEAAEAFEMWNIARRDARRALVRQQRGGS